MAISIDWVTVRIEMDGAYVVCVSLFSLEHLQAAGVVLMLKVSQWHDDKGTKLSE